MRLNLSLLPGCTHNPNAIAGMPDTTQLEGVIDRLGLNWNLIYGNDGRKGMNIIFENPEALQPEALKGR